jgi:broad specificity phosphatase PhoE
VSSSTARPLTPRGRAQARALRLAFARVPAATVHSSDLPRALETATALAGWRSVSPSPGLRELSLGALDGARAEAIFGAFPGFLRDPNVALPGGESPASLARRAGRAMERILVATGERHVIVVAHGGVNRALLSRLLGISLERALRIRQDWAGVNILDLAAGRWWARALNWTPAGLRELSRAPDGAAPRSSAPLAAEPAGAAPTPAQPMPPA